MDWSKDQVATLAKMWAQRASARDIAERLGMSRNQVIGKAHRLHLESRPNPCRSAGSGARPRAVRQTIPTQTRVQVARLRETIARPPARPPVPRVNHDLQSRRDYYQGLPTNGHACEWRDGERPHFTTCPEPAVISHPFCREHCARAYLQPKKQKPGQASLVGQNAT